MARRLSDTQRIELEEIGSRALLFLDFLETLGLSEESVGQMRAAVQSGLERNDLAGLREVRRDFDEWLRELPPQSQEAFKRLVASRTGVDLDSQRDAELQEIRRLLDRGVIRTEEEFRLVQGRLDEIYADPDRAPECAELGRLLNTFSQ